MIKEAFKGFEKPSIAVDTVIIRVSDFGESTKRQLAKKKLQVLLVKDDNENEWHLPGTIIRLGETSKSAILRIFNQYNKIDDIKFEQLYTVDNDLYRDERGQVISIVYIGMLNEQSYDLDMGFINEKYRSQWFWVDKDRFFENLKNGDKIRSLKYDHVSIINDTIARLKGKLLYTDVGFNFVKETFTIRELEDTFSAINERQIPGFRRIIANKIEDTGLVSDGKAFRPASIYKRKEKPKSE